MTTKLAIDERLVAEAQTIGGHKTRDDAITAALQEYIERRKQLQILELAGTIEYYPDYDPKELRRRESP